MPSIGVLEPNQRSTDRPSRRIKRAGGQSLVRQMKAFWIVENVLLQMLAEGRARQISQAYANSLSTTRKPTPICGNAYIPETMPPVIDKRLGVHFEDPCKSPVMPRFRRISNFDRLQQFEA